MTRSTSTVGSTHTQWCDHDTGETTRPNIATQISASTGFVARSKDPAHRPHRQRQHREAGQRPQHEPRALAEAEPGQRARDVLVGVQRRGADPVGVAHGLGPVLQESRQASANPTSVATDRRRRGDQQGAGVAAQQEVQQEHRGRELQRDRHARAAARAATASCGARSRR